VKLRYIDSYVLLRDECDRDNVVPLHIIMCRNYSTGTMILCYVYTLNNVQSTFIYVFVSMKRESVLCFSSVVARCAIALYWYLRATKR
jgi:hypothetical protein